MDDDVSIDELDEAMEHKFVVSARFVEAVDVHEIHSGATVNPPVAAVPRRLGAVTAGDFIVL